MSKAAENTKDRGTLALLGLMIMCNAVIFTVAGDAPQTFVLAVVGLAGSFVMRTPLPRMSLPPLLRENLRSACQRSR
ncbi:MAG: hypothetical protein HN742_27345 [Lentisphaerae bacterium]|jgi:hypothetical protein|nr:hypothetical protein [Lentisphaerota bacterium]MBT7062198.1 hypothetical protein [Lentisphaerota bacterium]MBT7845619.1 hypothetical protein [Lentisphaerota bacterium]